MSNTVEEFRLAMRDAGIEPSEGIITDSALHRFNVVGDKARSFNGWYVFYDNDPAAGAFGCWKRGISETWCSKTYQTMTTEEKADYSVKMEAMKKQRKEERGKVQAECREQSAALWENGRNVDAKHPYLIAKQIKPHGVKQLKESLLVPVRDSTGNLHGLQFISATGEKKFKTGTAVAGCYLSIGKPNGKVLIAEGYATGTTLHELTGHAVAIAFNAGNLKPVAAALRTKYPALEIIICADDDHATEANTGLTKATEAARAVNGLLAVPAFPVNRGPSDTDFNDLARMAGPEAVKACIEAATIPTPALSTENSLHAESESLEPEAWPVLSEDALPGWLGEFIETACEHSEADQAAILTTLLCRFAAEVGAGAYVNVGDARHWCRTNAVIVGASSKSRKGTSVKPVERLFHDIPSGVRCTPGPLSSGEGLIYAVRDEVTEFNKKSQEHVVSDPGITDKRMFVLDEEFAAALNCTTREGNTLSAIIRGFFDDGNAEPLTKSWRIKATGAHVVIVTHITELELVSLLNQVQMTNGFGNRFLWILSRRQKLLALPSPMPASKVDRIRKIVVERLKSASTIGAIGMNDDARRLWTISYPGLTMDYAGAAGAVVNRTEAHAIRLALIYALCAGHSQIEVDDLKAAIALVDYSRRSAFRIFGSVSQDKKKSKILNALQSAVNHEMTITEISSEIFSRNMKSDDLHKLLAEMESSRLIVQEKSPTGGAPKNVVRLASALRKNELNEVMTIRLTPLNSLNSLIRTSETEIMSFTEADFNMENAL